MFQIFGKIGNILFIYSSATIRLNLRSLNEVNVGEQVSKMVVVHSRAPTGRICIRYVIQKCALLGM